MMSNFVVSRVKEFHINCNNWMKEMLYVLVKLLLYITWEGYNPCAGLLWKEGLKFYYEGYDKKVTTEI